MHPTMGPKLHHKIKASQWGSNWCFVNGNTYLKIAPVVKKQQHLRGHQKCIGEAFSFVSGSFLFLY